MNSTEIIHGVKVNARSRTIPYLSKNFVGREDEVRELLELVNFDSTEVRIIGIIGSPGFGKSTLAIQLGHRLIDRSVYVHYVDMAEFPSLNVELVLAEKILKSSDITAKRITFDRLLRWARERDGHTLLILDNCDKVLHTQKDQLRSAILQIVQASTSVKIIMTSREVAVQIEHYTWYKVYELSSKAAILLLEQKLSNLKLSLKEKEEIAELTGKVPLALHIVGSLLTLPDPVTPSLVIEELKQNPVNFLSPKELPVSLRISASISLSYRYLDNNLKAVAYFLALFPGSFDKGAALGISAEYLKSLSEEGATILYLRLGQSELRTLVDRSLLEYNERIGRYQYHRLIREFLLVKTDDPLHKIDYYLFHQNFREYFLKQLHQHTVDFKLKYVDSLKFLDTERHNIYSLLQGLVNPEYIHRLSLLLTVESLTHAIKVEYLTCRFTSLELADFFNETVHFLTANVLTFQVIAPSYTIITTISGKQWTQREYYQRVFIQLIVTFSDLLEKTYDKEFALNFLKNKEEIVDSLSKATEKDVFSPAVPNPSRNPDSIPLSTKATHRAFYVSLCDRYLALGQHANVVICQLKIIKDAQKCNVDSCTYREVGYMYLAVGNNEEAARFLELSLENDDNNLVSKASILVNLLSLYRMERSWPWISLKERSTANQLFDISNEILKMEDQVLFHNWKEIVRVIVSLNRVGKNTNFLEERLFSTMSTPSKQFQLQPKEAVHLLGIVEQSSNYSKTILWGTLLLHPFENYHNFSTEEKLNVLKMQVATATAKLQLSYFSSEGLNELEYVFEILVHDQELRNHPDSAQIYESVCYSLVIRVKYILPCYQETIIAATKNALAKLFITIPTKLAYITFVIPLGFIEEQPYHMPEGRDPVPTKYDSSKAIATTSSQTYELIETTVSSIVTDVGRVFQSFYCDNVSPYYWLFIKISNISRFCFNLLLVSLRLLIMYDIFVILTGISAGLCAIILEKFLAQLYFVIILNPSSFTVSKFLISSVCDLFIFLSIVQVKLSRNVLGYPWLFIYVAFSRLNLGLLYPFDPEQDDQIKRISFPLFVSLMQFIIIFLIFFLLCFAFLCILAATVFIVCLYGFYCLLFWLF